MLLRCLFISIQCTASHRSCFQELERHRSWIQSSLEYQTLTKKRFAAACCVPGICIICRPSHEEKSPQLSTHDNRKN
uniref:Uncharacterized protein n=1 Tax=Arundo donax TaxID=35708 RepID=A0A0A9E3P9_ARUDO